MANIETTLTSEEVHIIWSRFSASCVRLKQSGDYPEETVDRRIKVKLLDIKFQLEQLEGR